MDTNPLVTITTFSSVGGAVALQTYLEDHQIPVFLPDGLPTQDSWDGPAPVAIPLNNIRIQVSAHDEEKAVALMNEFFRVPEGSFRTGND